MAQPGPRLPFTLWRAIIPASLALLIALAIWPVLPLIPFAFGIVTWPALAISLVPMTIGCVRVTGRCPTGVYVHLAGMGGLLASPWLIAPLVWVAPIIAGGLLLCGLALFLLGPLLAIHECHVHDLPPDCRLLAWGTVAHLALA